MATASSSQLETAATEVINRAMAARNAVEGVEAAITAAAGQTIPDAVQRCIQAHADTVAAANALNGLVDQNDVDASGAAKRLVETANDAKAIAEELKTNPTKAVADNLGEKGNDVVAKANNTRSVLRLRQKTQGIWERIFSNLSTFFGSIGAIACTVLLIIGAYVLFGPLYHQHELLDRIANVEYARGLLTYIIGLGVIVIALLLALAAVLGSDAQKDNFNRGKEVLTALIGILGTILGFYYGSEKSSTSHLEITAGTVVRAPDESYDMVALTVAGGKPPYVYSFSSEADDITPVMGKKSVNGIVIEPVSAKKGAKLPPRDKLKLTFSVTDSNNVKASQQITEPAPTPVPSPTPGQ